MSRLVLLLLAVASAGCNSAYRNAMQQGDEARERGDLRAAALAYGKACELKPDEVETCALAIEVRRQEVSRVLALAERPCNEGSMADCLAALGPTRKLSPDSPDLLGMIDDAALRHARSCGLVHPTDIVMAGNHLGCLLRYAKAIDRPEYDKHVAEQAKEGAVLARALAKEHASRPGASLAFWSAAACWDRVNEDERTRAAQGFRAASSVPVSVEMDVDASGAPTNPFTGTCAAVADLVPGSRCVRTGGVGAELEVRVDVPEHTRVEERKELEYQSGTRRVTNPKRDSAERAMDRAQSAFVEVEQDMRDRKAVCESTHTDQACRHYNAIVDTYNDRKTARDAAKRTLSDTPETIEEPVFSKFRYVTTHHTWITRYSTAMRFAGRTGGESAQLTFKDSEHVGFAPARLAPDALEGPAPDEFTRLIATDASRALAALVRQELADRGSRRREECGTPGWTPDFLQCTAEATLWSAGPPAPADFLSALGEPAPACR